MVREHATTALQTPQSLFHADQTAPGNKACTGIWLIRSVTLCWWKLIIFPGSVSCNSFWLRSVTKPTSPPRCWDFCPVDPCTGGVHAITVSLSSYVHLSCLSGGHFPWVTHHLWLLQCLCFLFSIDFFFSLNGRALIGDINWLGDII